MNVNDVNLSELTVLITRDTTTSLVLVKFTLNHTTITASMRCPRHLKQESTTQDKILTLLGFTSNQIQALHYD